MKELLLSWGLYFVVGKLPEWKDKEQVQKFFADQHKLILWAVSLTKTKVDDNLADLYFKVVSNPVMFEIAYEYMIKIWDAPDELIKVEADIDEDNNPLPDAGRVSFRERLKQRMEQRAAKRNSVQIVTEVAKPESPLAVIGIISFAINLAKGVIWLRNWRRKGNAE